MRYDLELFKQLNDEYQDKPIVPSPPKYDASSLDERSLARANSVARKTPLKGKRVLEIGCGRGETSGAFAKHYGCAVVGVDIKRYKEWADIPENVTLIETDLTEDSPPDIGDFDVIYSNSVWEHLRHPYSMLKKSHDLLRAEGRLLVSANLYRGPMASHRYRHVFFPWPHLLFTDEVFREFFVSIGHPPRGKAWVNQLSIADYQNYFDIIGFEVEKLTFSMRPFDEGFYHRFEEILGQFPRYDPERDFFHVVLKKMPDAKT